MLSVLYFTGHSVTYTVTHLHRWVHRVDGNWLPSQFSRLACWVLESTNNLIVANNMVFYYILEFHVVCLILRRLTRTPDIIIGLDVVSSRPQCGPLGAGPKLCRPNLLATNSLPDFSTTALGTTRVCLKYYTLLTFRLSLNFFPSTQWKSFVLNL